MSSDCVLSNDTKKLFPSKKSFRAVEERFGDRKAVLPYVIEDEMVKRKVSDSVSEISKPSTLVFLLSRQPFNAMLTNLFAQRNTVRPTEAPYTADLPS